VEAAIKIINDLPPASQTVLTNYPSNSRQINFSTESQNLVDLKSETLSLLLEQLGLAQPTRYIAVLKQWTNRFLEFRFPSDATYGDWAYPDYLVRRNFDPQTLSPSVFVNQTEYNTIMELPGYENIIQSIPVDPTDPTFDAVADDLPDLGSVTFFAGGNYSDLTQDDVGGISYLFSTNNIAYENLLADVSGCGTNAASFVNGALRPGIEKITFVLHPLDSNTGAFLATANSYIDAYITNGVLTHQQVKRVTTKPDFLFSVRNLNDPSIYLYNRTGTTNWINNAALNGSAEGGPGVICPQVKITFNNQGHYFFNDNDESATDNPTFWASFDGSTNAPTVYPVSSLRTNQFLIRMWLVIGQLPSPFPKNPVDFEWIANSAIGSTALFQTSTNLTSWTTIFTATNDGTTWNFYNQNPVSVKRFYRVVPQ
jgi:hypothetical protein